MGKVQIRCVNDCRDKNKVFKFVKENDDTLKILEGTNHTIILNEKNNEKTFLSRHPGEMSWTIAKSLFLFFKKAGLLLLLAMSSSVTIWAFAKLLHQI